MKTTILGRSFHNTTLTQLMAHLFNDDWDTTIKIIAINQFEAAIMDNNDGRTFTAQAKSPFAALVAACERAGVAS
jgi:GTPase SAR1 family protein